MSGLLGFCELWKPQGYGMLYLSNRTADHNRSPAQHGFERMGEKQKAALCFAAATKKGKEP